MAKEMESQKTEAATDREVFDELMRLHAEAAGKSLSSILKTDIEIYDPKVTEMTVREVEYSILEPAIFVRSCLTSNVAGDTVLILRQRDMQAFLNELMGIDDLPDPDFEFDEVAMSAATELMNQMVQAAVGAMAQYLGDTMEASECKLSLSDGRQNLAPIIGEASDSKTTVVHYHIRIKDMVESEFLECISATAEDSILQEIEAKKEAEARALEEAKKAEEALIVGSGGRNGGLAGQNGYAGGNGIAPGGNAGQNGYVGGNGNLAGQNGYAGGTGGLAGQSGYAGGTGGLAGQNGYVGGTGGMAGQNGYVGGTSGLAGQNGYAGGTGGLAGQNGYNGGTGGLAGQNGYAGGNAGASGGPSGLAGRSGVLTGPAGSGQGIPGLNPSGTFAAGTLHGAANGVADSWTSGQARQGISENLGLIMDVPLNVSVEIGKTRRRLKDVLNFNNGTVVELDKQADAPVDIIVNGQLIARGEVVVIDDNFGVRISEIINTRSIIGNGE